MGDWTTKKLSDTTEVDIHPDTDSFPVVIKTTLPYNDQFHGIVLSTQESFKLMLELMAHFGQTYVEK